MFLSGVIADIVFIHLVAVSICGGAVSLRCFERDMWEFGGGSEEAEIGN